MEQEQQRDKVNEGKKKAPRKPWDIRPYLALGLTAILVVVVSIIIFFLVFRFEGFSGGVRTVIRSLQSIVIGVVLAYIINPIMVRFERLFNKHVFKNPEKSSRQRKRIRGLSVTLAVLVFLAIVAALLSLIIPALIFSIEDVVLTMGDKVQSLIDWIERLISQDSNLANTVESFVSEASVYLQDWLKEKVLEPSGLLISLTEGVYNIVRTIFNMIIGLIVSVYILLRKEWFVGMAKKIVYAIFRPKWGNLVMDVVRKADDVFGGFFIGKIIDSLIIGCICFVGCSIMKTPYTMLVSVIVGVTNIIPFFGPYIGAIPSLLLIFLVDPMKALYFLIFIVVLQQVDGNIIGPRILGNTTGLSPFWVIFAILLFGGSFGVVGMIFGVPIFAVIYYIVKRIVEDVLRKRKLPDSTDTYAGLDYVDVQTNQVQELREKEGGAGRRHIMRKTGKQEKDK